MADFGVPLFFYLIRIVVFSTRYRCLDCCTVLSGKVFLQFLLLRRVSLFCPLFFHSLWSNLFYNVDVCIFSWVLTLFDTFFYTVFVHRVVITVRAFGFTKKYRTVSTPRRRYTHLRCRTSSTTRNEKTADKTKKHVATTKTAGKLLPDKTMSSRCCNVAL